MGQEVQAVEERRKSKRFKIQAPLTMIVGSREVQAFTRDLSARSVYFLLSSSDTPEMGQDLEFVIEIPPAISFSELCRIQGRGRTIRLEDASRNETGVVAEILSYEIVKNKQASVGSGFALGK